MYYKIINKECEFYKKLQDLRIKEIEIDKENHLAIEEKTGLKFKVFYGDCGQQNFRRVPQYVGFQFLDKNVDSKIWNINKDHKDVYVPNRKTKLGREISQFLFNGLKASCYDKVWQILKVKRLSRFQFPWVEIVGEIALIFLDDRHEPNDPNIIEITKSEFNQLALQS